jgi:molecular chaperone DnaK (HSP70)
MAARIGIDFGTTNTVVALADRGNYPVLPLPGGVGRDGAQQVVPSVLAWRGQELRFFWDAYAVWDEQHGPAASAWQILSSPKRYLGQTTPALPALPEGVPSIDELLRRYFVKLVEDIRACPHLEGEDEIEAMIGVPANANSLQRLRTLEAARAAGLRVLGLLHEPTAAAIEYAHRNPAFCRGGKRHVLVYDLGGGTFDVALLHAGPEGIAVDASAGVGRLGGDDFDEAMAELVAAEAGLGLHELSWNARQRLLLRCREAKEALRATTRRWLIDLTGLDGFDEEAAGEIAVDAAAYAERCLPLIERTIGLMGEIMGAARGEGGLDLERIDALLLCGGASQLPLLQRRLKEVVGARLKISPHPFAATAIGLAIHAERHQARPARQRFARCFGVWREAEGGARRTFDPIFTPEMTLPPQGQGAGALVVERAYHPAHNIGHYRFEECAGLGPDGAPDGDRTPWCEIRFPYDPALPGNDDGEEAVTRTDRFADQLIRERYECDSEGMITVRLRREGPRSLERSYLLYGPEEVAPVTAPVKRASRRTP